jgi:hypothetical protein
LLDRKDCIETDHLHAAKRIWDYCQDSARFIFSGTTADQEKILRWIGRHNAAVSFAQIREDLFQKHRKADWIKLQIGGLVQAGKLVVNGDWIAIKP